MTASSSFFRLWQASTCFPTDRPRETIWSLEWVTTESSAMRQSMLKASPESIAIWRSEEHTSELQSLMRTSYAVLCLKKKTKEVKITRKEKKKDDTTNQLRQ